MADPHQAAANRHLRMLFDAGTVVGLSDGQLLELFETRREETAFTALIERHGPMVQRVCGEVLGNHHDAEDAFQATFLVLARHAGSIRRRDSVASWLYGVALRVAACFRSATARRRRHERNWAGLRSAEVCDEAESREDFGPLLHAELGRLPERFRAPVVLCYLEGRTYEEAAGLLRCPVGTIKSRLSTARQRLRRRLEPVALTGSIDAEPRTEAVVVAVPARLVETTVRAATQGTASGVITAAVARLAEGVLKAMLLKRVCGAAAMIIVAALATGASGWAWQAKSGGDSPKAKVDNPHEAKPTLRASEPRTPSRPNNATNLSGRVIDEQGRPVPDARVDFFAPPPLEGEIGPVELQTHSDTGGQFRLALPPLGRNVMNPVHVWADRPGLAIAAMPSYLAPFDLVLRKPQPRTLKLERPDGRPIAGAIISPRVVFTGENSAAELSATLAMPLIVTTGPDGQATLNCLAGGDKLFAVRVTAGQIGTQDLQLLANPRSDTQAATITIRLKPTNHLAGHVRNQIGKPVAGQTVEVWFKGSAWLPPSLVEFKDGPVRTASDGSFRTPDSLFVGSQYRVSVRAPGYEPILSKWIPVGEQPRILLPMLQWLLRTISGRVVDRQGRPLANVEVFQSGDGPERTATRTDGDGRFGLGGFNQGPVFIFARSEGFRFLGRLIKPGEGEITLELTRTTERPTREMRMLPEPIPLEESRALAQRLIEPYWQVATASKKQSIADRALRLLAMVDPARVLQKLDAGEIEPATPLMNRLLRSAVSRALARSDTDQAQQVAEAIESPANRCTALLAVADALPPEERDRKLAVLTRAERHAKESKSQFAAADVAERWYELGERDRAKTLFAESLRLRPDNRLLRGRFAARLSCFDLPAALAIARELPETGFYSVTQVYWNIALRLAADNPAEAERVLRLVPQAQGRVWLPPAVAWKMAASDPARARRLVDEVQRYDDHPQTYLFLALGLKQRDRAGAEQAFWKAIEGIDRLMKEGVEYSAMNGTSGALLPLVERIDPTLVPELFWRAIATRPPIGNPRTLFHATPIGLVILLSWYDREAAAALYEPVRTEMEQTDESALADWGNQFLSWSLFDPRAAVARIEHVPVSTESEGSNFARELVAEMLALSYEDRWRQLWSSRTEMGDLLDRDIR